MSTLVKCLLDFFEVSVHTILYVRNIYPRSIFEKRLKYNVPVWMSRHRDVNSYIVRALQNSKQLLEQGLVEKIVVPITGPDLDVQESFVFSLSSYFSGPEIKLHSLERSFRTILTKLNLVENKLRSLHTIPDGSRSFKIAIVAKIDDAQSIDKVCQCTLQLPHFQSISK